MGRAGRQNIPPGLQELEEHGVPEGWHGFWHGQKREVRDFTQPSPFPSEIEEDLRSRPWSYEELSDFFHGDWDWSAASVDDPVLKAAIQNQIEQLQEPLMQMADPELDYLVDLETEMIKNILASNGRDFYLWGEVLRPGGITFPRDPDYVRAEGRFAESLLGWMSGDPDSWKQFVQEQLLPGILYATFGRRQNSDTTLFLFEDEIRSMENQPIWQGILEVLDEEDVAREAKRMRDKTEITEPKFYQEFITGIARSRLLDGWNVFEPGDRPGALAFAARESFLKEGRRKASQRSVVHVLEWFGRHAGCSQAELFQKLPALQNQSDAAALWLQLERSLQDLDTWDQVINNDKGTVFDAFLPELQMRF